MEKTDDWVLGGTSEDWKPYKKTETNTLPAPQCVVDAIKKGHKMGNPGMNIKCDFSHIHACNFGWMAKEGSKEYEIWVEHLSNLKPEARKHRIAMAKNARNELVE